MVAKAPRAIAPFPVAIRSGSAKKAAAIWFSEKARPSGEPAKMGACHSGRRAERLCQTTSKFQRLNRGSWPHPTSESAAGR